MEIKFKPAPSINIERDEELEKKIIKSFRGNDKRELFIVNERLSKKACSYALILIDIEIIETCLEKVIELIDKNETQDIITSALWQRAIMTYGKIFTNSKDGFTRLEYDKIISDEKQLELHHKLIDIRNSFIAHRGKNDFEKTLLVATLNKTKEGCFFEYSFPTALLIGHYLSEEELLTLKSLLRTLNDKVNAIAIDKVDRVDRFLHLQINNITEP